MKKIHLVEKVFDKISAAAKMSRVIMVFGLCLICYIWVDFYYAMVQEQKTEYQGAVKETANFARTFEEHTLRTIKNADQTAFFIKQQYERNDVPQDMPNYIQKGRFLTAPFLRLRVFDSSGYNIASSQAGDKTMECSSYEYFFVHRYIDSGQIFIGSPLWEADLAKWVIPMTRRINKADGAFGGVVAVYVDSYYFSDFYKQIDLGRDSSIVLVGRDGIIRTRQAGDSTIVGKEIQNSEFNRLLQNGDSGSYIMASPIDGVRRIYSYRALQNYPFAVIVGVSEEEVLQRIHERTFSYGFVASLVTLAILAFIYILLRVSGHQQAAEKALQAAHDELERQVMERTRELSEANTELIAMNESLSGLNQELEEEILERQRTEAKLRNKNEEIFRIAYFDALTGLPNRLRLTQWLTGELSQLALNQRPGAMAFIDLDDIKMINDSFGHSCGDAIIRLAGQRIAAVAGKDAFVARIGGDEFTAIFPGMQDAEQISARAQRIITEIGRKYQIGDTDFHVTASMGFVVYPQDGDTVQELLKNADNAMYAAKRDGKNCWRLYASDMQAEVYEKILLSNSLRTALERDEFVLHYQPQMDIKSGKISGFEALIRWNSPQHGLVSPARFIPVAEQSGLIQTIGKWVIQEACRFVKRLEKEGYRGMYVAVNVSAHQLSKDNFVDMVKQILVEAALRKNQLEIEITESVLLSSVDESIQKLENLRALGIKLSLDDFGVGYSSLTYLRQLPVDTLKIDKSFVDLIGVDSDGAEIIGAIINMAHVLNKNVIAEGVEAESQLQYLAQKNCDCIQGYFFSRPLPENEAIAFWIKKFEENHP